MPGLTAELARDELDDINRCAKLMDDLAARISAIVTTAAPALLSVPGCGELTATKIVPEPAGVELTFGFRLARDPS